MRRLARVTVVLVVLVVLTGGGYWLAGRAGVVLPGMPPCLAETEHGRVSLSRDDAMLATTAAATGETSEAVEPAVAAALRESSPDGSPGPLLTCRASMPEGLAAEEPTETGLTPRAEALRGAMAEVFGEQSVGGFEPGGVTSGHGERSAHYDGRAIDVFYRPVEDANLRDGWTLAHWLVAYAEEYGIATVIFDDRIWSSRRSRLGWRDYTVRLQGDPATDEILRHRDHVHVDVTHES